MSIQDYDGLSMPLDGIRLIEASAGTGKTFSLAGLYLRLLLEKQLDVSQILVMTFTRAASRELRERIRLRINQAAQQALHPENYQAGEAEADFTEALLQRAEQSREDVAQQLISAARRMDEAVIVTIHGYSQRAAADNAFDSALPFDRGEAVDDNALMREVAQDYWRQQALQAHHCERFLSFWPNAEALLDDLKPFSQQAHLQIAGPDEATLKDWTQQARDLWAGQKQALETCLQQALDNGELYKGFCTKLPHNGDISMPMQQLDEAIAQSPMALPKWILELAQPSEVFKKKALPAGQAQLEQLSVLPWLFRIQPTARMQALRQAHSATQRMARARKLQRRQYSFADMIGLLHHSIHAEHGDSLAQALHDNWPWALVDEFQDTDPQQYQILQKCYRNQEHGGLILIGDPKQAIYSFRGGDVHAYLKAAQDAQDQRYGLRQNFRSTAAYLRAVENLFSRAGDEPFLLPGIAFDRVSAGRGEHSQLLIQGQPQAAMNIHCHAPPSDPSKAINKESAEPACRLACIAQIRQLLEPGNQAVLRQKGSHGSSERPVLPSDIAVLVNTNQQASDTQRALSAAGIAAVCVHQQSVYQSDQAQDLLRVLLAVAQPTDERLLRGALSSELMACPLSRLIQYESDEAAWQQQVEQFQQAHESWRRHGVLALLQQLLQQHSSSILAGANAQRRMSNYLQLAELLAELEREHFGISGVLQAFSRAIAQADDDHGDRDAQQLRLESDAALVRVVTVHKSKGLEYPIVLLPYAPWLGTQGKPHQPPVRYHRDNQSWLDLDPDDDAIITAVQERRSEALRLLYVALTRAEVACYWPWGQFNQAQNSAMGALLHRDALDMTSWAGRMSLSHEQIQSGLQALQAASNNTIQLLDWPQAEPHARLNEKASAQLALQARSDLPHTRPSWRMNSFSRLARNSEAISLGGADDETSTADVSDQGEGPALPQLPGGARFGNAIHIILEQLDAAAWRQPEQQDTSWWDKRIEDAFKRFGVRWDDHRSSREVVLENTRQLLIQTLNSPIAGIGRLQDIAVEARRVEMEFHLRMGKISHVQLLDLLKSHGYAQNLQASDMQASLRGLMHGFIDLLVEKDQRFYVLDYKSNWLGDRQSHYQAEQLAPAMAQHHYDLQYLIYMVALHRYLAQRLPDYDPQQHLGGVRYLFVRGMSPQHPGDGVFSARPDSAFILQLDQAFNGAGA